jgi:flagellar protein FlgJ
VLVRQLSSMAGMPEAAPAAGSVPPANADSGMTASDAARPAGTVSASARSFRERLAVHAEAASRETGIPAKFMLGQAALESGWGKHEIRYASGAPSHNLFGIKANAGWKGKVVEAVTTEYVNGVAQTRTEKFRAYDSYADAFRDYARLLRSNPRYEAVLASGGDAAAFAQGLQRAGYATDPHYAAKLTRIINNSLSA